MWCVFIIAIIILWIIFICILVSKSVVHRGKRSIDAMIRLQEENNVYDKQEFMGLAKEEIQWISPYGYIIKGWYIPYRKNNNKIIIISHGVGQSRYLSIQYYSIFRSRGYDIVTYDHRNHGESGGDNIGYGYYEKDDLKVIVDWCRNKPGNISLVGIHGESMGAGVMLMYAGMVEDGADFYISDCSYANFKEEIIHVMKTRYRFMPIWMVSPFMDIITRILAGYSLKDISPISGIKNVSNPVLFIHSIPDTFIPYEMAINLYRSKVRGVRKIYLAKKGGHAMSHMKNREEYTHRVNSFIDLIEMGTAEKALE